MSAVPSSFTATSLDRRIQMLRTAMGPLIAAALEDPDVVEIMLNPDRTLWVDRLSSGRTPLGVELSEDDGERIIRLVAAHVGAEVHRGRPLLTAELPETGERFEGILPPAAPGPAFALRKRAVSIIGLDRYVADGILTTGKFVSREPTNMTVNKQRVWEVTFEFTDRNGQRHEAKARSTDESTRTILEGMTWLGLHWDEGPVHQADGLARHQAAQGKTVFISSHPWVEYVLPFTATVASIFAVVYSLRFGHDVFFGPPPRAYAAKRAPAGS